LNGPVGVSSRVSFQIHEKPAARRLISSRIGIIEKSCIDGQKTYHIDLDKAIRGYIQNHLSEFVPEGITEAEAVVTRAAVAATPEPIAFTSDPRRL
jgi:hypothetical protein